jgi:serine/threonine protein kinase
VTRYELLDRIGVGGMAEIFRGKAVAAGGFEKPVAIKRILPHLSQDRRFVELLIAEAKVLSLLKHRNIVQIFDVGLGDDGQYFLVMEFVDGKDLGAIQRALEQKRRRMPFDLALHVGAEICEALEHAHTSRGPDGKPMALVHRDVSPSNVLLSRAGEVKLTDFGIAKRAEQDPTHAGAVRGKFAYISPEQARNEPLDPRSDVFSVGILMWELVTSRRLFSNLDDLAALRAVRDPNVPRPTELDRSLPAEIDQILLMALARDKQRRFSSCGALGQKLRSLRYSLSSPAGDPATELAKIIDSTEALERESKPHVAPRSSGRFDFDGAEATVIRIRTAEAFGNDISQARMVIDKFEEEETRLASVSSDQMRMLRDARPKRQEVPELTSEASPHSRRARGRDSATDDEMTHAREPLDMRKVESDSYTPSYDTPAEDTRLISPRDRHTPPPARTSSPSSPPPRSSRPSTAPPPPARPRGATPGPPLPGMPPPVIHPGTPVSSPSIPQPLSPNKPVGGPTQSPPFVPSQPAGGFAPSQFPQSGWGPPIASRAPRDATPTSQDSFDRPMFGNRGSAPQVAGFNRARKPALKPWVLVVGALIMAMLAFAITRAFLS